ncbi:MAG: oligosaccharide flippase family protein [Halobacteriota archaeon]
MAKYTLTARRLGLTAVVTPIVTLSNLILLPILTKNLAVADYGAWALITVTIGLVPWLTTLGLGASMTRFLAAATDKREIQEGFYSMGFIVLVTSSIVSGLLLLLVQQIAASLFNNNLTIALLLIFNIWITSPTIYAIQYFMAFQQIKRYSFVNLFSAYLNTALVAFFVLFGYGLEGAVIALSIQQLVVFAVVLFLIVTQIGFAIPKLRRIREYLAFGLPLLPSALSGWIVNSSDRYLIALFLGATAVGYYSPGYALGSILAMVAAPLASLLPPVLFKHYDDNETADVRTIMSYSLKYYSGIVLPCVFAMSVLSKPLLLVLTTKEIAENGYLVTPLVAAGAALTGVTSLILLILMLEKKTTVIGTISILSALFNFGLNLVLIPYLGLIGAALTTFLAFLLAFVLTAHYSLKLFTFDVNYGFIVKSVFGSCIIALFLFLWNPSGLLSMILSIALAAVIYLAILLGLRGLTMQEIKLIYRIYRGS